jgi:hypothetical protein
MGSSPSRMPCVTFTRVARAPSPSQPQYTVSSPFIVLRFRSLQAQNKQNPDAHNVCRRAKNHYDPQQVQRLFDSDLAGTEDSPPDTADRARARRGGARGGGRGARGGRGGNEFQSGFQQAHERQAERMYFC